jgi:DNA primase
LERELSLLDETLDLAQELAGARLQLQQEFVQKKEGVLLDRIRDKPLSSLTEEERVLLKSLGNKAGQKKG